MAGSSKTEVLAIVGPTASGKSDLALRLALHLGAEIVSADSRQVFRHLNIGTAKPLPSDLALVPHHFIDILEPDQEFSAGAYGAAARESIAEISARGKKVVIVGGSGLYIRALLDGLFDGPAKHREVRERLEERIRTEGTGILLEELRRVDPDAAAEMNTSNTRRIIRALEVFEVTGKPISAHHRAQPRSSSIQCVQLALHWPREQLYERIERRVLTMLEAGLLREVKELAERGYGPHLNALNTVGYKEAFAHLGGSSSEREMIQLIQQNTRRYAKRQMTWFRADERIHWLPANQQTSSATIFDKAVEFLQASQPQNR